MTREQAREITKKALNSASVAEVEIALNHTRHGFLRFARSAPTTSGLTLSGNAVVTAWKGRRRAMASAAVDLANPKTAIDELRQVVAEAERLASIAPEDREYLPLLGPQEYIEVSGYDPATAEMTPGQRAQKVSEAVAVTNQHKLVAAGFFEQSGTDEAIANSAGLFAYHRGSVATFSITARTPDERGSGYVAVSSTRLGSLHLGETAAIAVKKAIDSRDGREIKPGTYPAILEPQAVADLVGSRMRGNAFFPGLLDARMADEGRSAFSAPGGKTKLGEQIFDRRVNLYSDPAHPTVPSRPFDDSGYPIRKAEFIREGVVRNLVHSRFWAQRNKKSPGPFLSNLIMDGSDKPISKLIEGTERGVLVTRLWYIRIVDRQQALFTGLTRDGLFWIEDGRIRYPLKNFRFNESPYRLLTDVDDIGQTLPVVAGERYQDFRMVLPALKFRSFRFTSISDAV